MTKETYLKSVDILLDAYNSRTLFRGSCEACAVGHMLQTPVWGIDFASGREQDLSNYIMYSNCDPHKSMVRGPVREAFDNLGMHSVSQIRQYLDNLYSSHGFTREELATIEREFEKSGETQLEGLRAVLKVMATMVDEPTDSEPSLTRLESIHSKLQLA